MGDETPHLRHLLSLTPYPTKLLPLRDATCANHTSSGYPILPAPSSNAPSAGTLLTSLLSEAIPILSSAAPRNSILSLWTQDPSPKRYSNCDATVHLSSNVVNGENWVCRVSKHRDAEENGTASWAEFERGFMTLHSLHESQFTPSVVGYGCAGWWEDGVKGEQLDINGERWEGVTLELVVLIHKLPFPLKRRSFPVIQGIAKRVDVTSGEFAVVTIPAGVDWNLRSNEVQGRYVAVERFRRVGEEVEWVMATASDAGGVLPKWVQDKAVPGQIAKDVKFFLKWVDDHRSKGQE